MPMLFLDGSNDKSPTSATCPMPLISWIKLSPIPLVLTLHRLFPCHWVCFPASPPLFFLNTSSFFSSAHTFLIHPFSLSSPLENRMSTNIHFAWLAFLLCPPFSFHLHPPLQYPSPTRTSFFLSSYFPALFLPHTSLITPYPSVLPSHLHWLSLFFLFLFPTLLYLSFHLPSASLISHSSPVFPSSRS